MTCRLQTTSGLCSTWPWKRIRKNRSEGRTLNAGRIACGFPADHIRKRTNFPGESRASQVSSALFKQGREALGTNQPGGLPFYFQAVRRGREGALGVRRERMGILGRRARRAPPQNPLVLTYPQQRRQQKQVSPFLLTGNAQSANEGSALLALRLSTQFLSAPISRCGGGDS